MGTAGVTPPPLTTTVYSSDSWIFRKKDDINIILLLGMQDMGVYCVRYCHCWAAWFSYTCFQCSPRRKAHIEYMQSE